LTTLFYSVKFTKLSSKKQEHSCICNKASFFISPFPFSLSVFVRQSPKTESEVVFLVGTAGLKII